jgi:septum site-determining protein MinC
LSGITTSRQALRFKGKSYLALVLTPEAPIEAWLEDLLDLSTRSPGFFTTRPVVLDLSDAGLPPKDVKALINALDRMGIRVMGIEGARHLKLPAGMPPVLNGGRKTGDVEAQEEAASSRAPKTGSMIVENVRSGQSIANGDGDITVMGSVASGAEVIAAGSVHIYGALRGRVIAGAYGNPHARIFVKKLQAEFLAIDAVYLAAEGIDPELMGQSVQIWSEDDTIKLSNLR